MPNWLPSLSVNSATNFSPLAIRHTNISHEQRRELGELIRHGPAN